VRNRLRTPEHLLFPYVRLVALIRCCGRDGSWSSLIVSNRYFCFWQESKTCGALVMGDTLRFVLRRSAGRTDSRGETLR